MEKSLLNKAHQQQRRAEALFRQNKFDDCNECHRRAIELLTEAAVGVKNLRSLESIHLQKEYHQKQIELVHIKKNLFKNYKKTMAHQKKSEHQFVFENSDHLEQKIFHTMEVHDSLIGYLRQRTLTGSDDENVKNDEEDKVDGSAYIKGNKCPKDDSTIIEELKLLSGQLRDSVQILLIQLDERNKEIDRLKTRIRELESGVVNLP